MTALIASGLMMAATMFNVADAPTARTSKLPRDHKRGTGVRAGPPMQSALASWYAEHGTGACGVGDVQSGYRFASLFLRCGARITFRHAGRTVTATMSDHGPYVSGRLFDLNGNLKAALACSDLCYLQWRPWTPPPPPPPPGARLTFPYGGDNR